MATSDQACLIIGVGFLLMSLVMFLKTRRFIKSALRAKGEVIKFGYRNSSINDRQLVAVIQYSVNKNKFTCLSMMFNKKAFYIGKKIDVLYEKGNSSHGQVASLWQLHFLELMVLIGGAGALFFLFFGR